MKFIIIGAGALGSLYAAYLARDGHDVSLVARGERAAALAKHGINVTGKDKFSSHCTIVTQPQTLGETDVLIVATKTYDTESALAPFRHVKASTAFSVQNGVLKNELVDKVFGVNATLGSISLIGADVLPAEGDKPGAVRYNLDGPTIIGEPAGGESSRAMEIVAAFERSGLKAQSSEDITSVEWSKFVAWSGFSALAVLTRLPTWQFMADVDTAMLVARVMRETAQVALRNGVTLQDSDFSSSEFVSGSEDDAVKFVQAYGEKIQVQAPNLRQSILQDADRNRPLEVDETLGYTLQLGATLGVPTPTLDLCCRVLRAVSRAAGRA